MKVTSTEAKGDTFSGINARAVINRNNQGSDMNKSVIAIAIRAQTGEEADLAILEREPS